MDNSKIETQETNIAEIKVEPENTTGEIFEALTSFICEIVESYTAWIIESGLLVIDMGDDESEIKIVDPSVLVNEWISELDVEVKSSDDGND